MRRFALIALLLSCLVPAVANAAQDSTVVTDNAPIRVEPRQGSKILEYLAIGTEVRVSSFPMAGGWYKVRSKTGAYGWIQEKFLSVYKEKQDFAAEELRKKREEERGPRPERDRKWFMRVLMGFDFFRPDDMNALFGFSDLNTGYTIGGEMGAFVSERMALAFRVEALVKDIVARETQSGLQFNLGLRAYPLMAGMDFFFAKGPALRFSVGVFGGVALATSFASEAMSLAPPNVNVLQNNAFTSLIRVNLTRPLGRIVSVFSELGYRYLRTSELDTGDARGIAGGPEIYAKDGTYRPRVIDLSGIVLAIGVGVHF